MKGRRRLWSLIVKGRIIESRRLPIGDEKGRDSEMIAMVERVLVVLLRIFEADSQINSARISAFF